MVGCKHCLAEIFSTKRNPHQIHPYNCFNWKNTGVVLYHEDERMEFINISFSNPSRKMKHKKAAFFLSQVVRVPCVGGGCHDDVQLSLRLLGGDRAVECFAPGAPHPLHRHGAQVVRRCSPGENKGRIMRRNRKKYLERGPAAALTSRPTTFSHTCAMSEFRVTVKFSFLQDPKHAIASFFTIYCRSRLFLNEVRNIPLPAFAPCMLIPTFFGRCTTTLSIVVHSMGSCSINHGQCLE